MPKIMLHSADARHALARGVQRLSAAVEPTLGPKGLNAMIDRPVGTPLITRDGVSIAAEIELPNRFENMGAQVAREVSMQTNEVAGDGTTTAIVLANAMVQRGVEATDAGAKAVDLCRGIDLAVAAVVEALKASAKPASDPRILTAVANIAATDRQARCAGGGGACAGRARGRDHHRIRRHHRDRARGGRGHVLRPRLSLAPHGDRSGEDGGGARQPADPDDRSQDQGARRRSPACAGSPRRKVGRC